MTDALKRAVADVLAGRRGLREAQRVHGVPYSTLRGAVQRQQAAQTDSTELRKRLAAAEAEAETARRIADLLGIVGAYDPEIPEWMVREPRKSSGFAGVPTLVLSDLHLGEVVEPAEVNGVNRFNSVVAEERLRRVVENTIHLCHDHIGHKESYPGIVVPLLGDFVTGEIHEELAKTNDESLLPTVLRCAELLTAALKTLADAFGRVYAPCCSGNHGRTTRRLQAKKFVEHNFDHLIYLLVTKFLGGDDRIKVHAPVSNEPLWRVYRTRFLGLHGHDLGARGGDGIIGALGPIMRGRLKVGAQQAEIGRDFDVLVIGHWHQYLPLPRVVVNNSLKGYDEFAAKFLRAPAAPPSQALFLTHPKYGVTCHWQVFADDFDANFEHKEWCAWKT